MTNLAYALATLSLLGGVGACAAQTQDKDTSDTFTDLGDVKADSFSYRMKIVDGLHFGATTDSVHYTKTPKYRAFTFSALPGNSVDVWVRSTNGDPVAWVLDDKFKILGKNDDASATQTDSHIELTIPAAEASADDNGVLPVFYVVFRDANNETGDFTVSIDGGPGYDEACSADADCQEVEIEACCMTGRRTVVAASDVQAYEDENACAVTPHPVCPLYVIYDPRIGSCDHTLHQCTLVKPAS